MQYLSYLLIRTMLFFISLLPYSLIHSLGRTLGTIAYYLVPSYRKKSLSNLALASMLPFSNEEMVRIAKGSMQNLAITALEYGKLSREKRIARIAFCTNPEKAALLVKNHTPPVFLCGHQANWEVLFLEGTSRMPGVAIGRPIKNRYLYRWIVQIREKFGGKIITPRSAVKEGLRALKTGSFLGIVGDQGMPDSGFKCSFLGREAWSSPLPALLAYRTGFPLLVAVTVREHQKYRISYSNPIYPQTTQPMDVEVPRIMREALHYFEQSVIEHPEQWMWQHNRWKQQSLSSLKKRYRQDAIGIILPQLCESLLFELEVFRKLYPTEFILVMAPEGIPIPLKDVEIRHYSKPEDLLITDYRIKLLYDLADYPEVRKFFTRLAAIATPTLDDLKKEAHGGARFSEILTKAVTNAS